LSLYLRFHHQNPVYTYLRSHTCYMPRPHHSSRFYHPNNIGRVRSLSSSLCSFLHSLVTSSVLGPNIFLSTLFSNTLILRSSLIVSGQVSHPNNATRKIIITYIFKHLSSKLEDKKFCSEG
jgi:hypothetical protein